MEIAWWQGKIADGGEKLSGCNSLRYNFQRRSFFLRKTKFQRRSFLAKKYKAHDPFPAQSKVSYIHRQIDHRRKAMPENEVFTPNCLLAAILMVVAFLIGYWLGG